MENEPSKEAKRRLGFLPNKLTAEHKFLILLLLVKVVAFSGIATTAEVDTSSYFCFELSGWVDETRTPLYPLLMYLFSGAVSEYALHLVTVLQFIADCIAVVLFSKILQIVCVHPTIRKIATAYYALSISTSVWSSIVLTESFSMSFTVFYLFFLVSYLYKHKNGYLYAAIGVIGLSICLRPTFTLYLAITLAFVLVYAICRKIDKKALVASILLMSFLVGGVSIYAAEFQKRYDSYSLSNTLLYQQLAILIRGDLCNTGDPEIISYICGEVEALEESNEYYLLNSLPELRIAHQVKAEFGNAKVSEFVGHNLKSNWLLFSINRVNAFLGALSLPYGRTPQLSPSVLGIPGILLNGISYTLISVPTFGFGVQIAFALFVLFVLETVKHKRINFLYLGMWSHIIMIDVSSVFGTCSDYARTSVTAVPFIILGCAVLIDKIIERTPRGNVNAERNW